MDVSSPFTRSLGVTLQLLPAVAYAGPGIAGDFRHGGGCMCLYQDARISHESFMKAQSMFNDT